MYLKSVTYVLLHFRYLCLETTAKYVAQRLAATGRWPERSVGQCAAAKREFHPQIALCKAEHRAQRSEHGAQPVAAC